MKLRLKHYLIPHSGNAYKPHFFRSVPTFTLSALVVLIFALTFSYTLVLPRLDYLAAVLPGVLVDLANADRDIYSLKPLTINPLLSSAAKEKAEDMARQGYFAHIGPSGISPWYWISKAGYQFIYAGENLAINFYESADVNKAWMDSSTHRANILNANFSEVGIATAQGLYEGRSTVFVVQMFGRPAEIPPITPITAHPIAEIDTIETVSIPQVKQILETPTLAIAKIASQEKQVEEKTLGSTNYASLKQKLLTNPRVILRLSYSALLALVLIAITLSLVIEIKRHHGRHLFSGALLVVLILALSYAYEHVATAKLLVL